MTLSESELEIYPHLASIAHWMMAECFSPRFIVPGSTTTDDLEWAYWQMCTDLGLELSFKPYYRIFRSEMDQKLYGPDTKTIHRGDLVHCDVGIRYLRLCTDHQELAYVRREGEVDAPPGMRRLLAENNRLQKIYQGEFKENLTGNEILRNILAKARRIRNTQSQGVFPFPRFISSRTRTADRLALGARDAIRDEAT